ncbi:Polyketide cyclase / dehydrase and lipid transport [Pirellulimonas nuda]|uniref:Polyketide cyclase / dehydrase and lipid transport n=1 Tax=Pirellulimonas nuda TaxID=2528009 RepID=A0A518DJ49_9BACT|nr:SRPBCC family protein [Pirellulimonas nuda]QDU91505.1 Polyketide cyclase / dehydrase and lipid transport [Pirellulimonas nuda]
MLRFSNDPERAGGYLLEAECLVSRPIGEVFAYFADALNLETLTPPLLRFKVLTPGPISMRRGLLIDYRLRLHGLPFRWRSEITQWEPERMFVDEQRRGPYRYWIHLHTFESVGDATRVVDRVRYGVPLGWLVHQPLVLPDLRKIFAYRHKALTRVFQGGATGPSVTGGPRSATGGEV